jgi:hypothetical protein
MQENKKIRRAHSGQTVSFKDFTPANRRKRKWKERGSKRSDLI